MQVVSIVLAAGFSRRFGAPKQRARLGDATLLERAVKTALAAGLKPVFVVLREEQKTAFCVANLDNFLSVPAVVPVLNPEAAEGMASSVRAGVHAAASAEGTTGVVVLACDQPAVTAEHLRELARGGDEVVASGYAGRKGVPAYFPARVFPELLELRGDAGARGLLATARVVELPGGELDIDTVEDLERAARLYGHLPGL
jgi:CTP:molybdopterin cytidylyltransferase MocA